jgi:hypothetical protein
MELETNRLKQQNDVRTTLLQAVGGVVLLIGVYFTWRQVQVSREGQLTERFNKAIDHLGAKELDLRLGGIYALERIAKNSKFDRPTIVEIFTAYARERSPLPNRQAVQMEETEEHALNLQARAPDIQAVMTVLGRLSRVEGQLLDLSGVDLRKALLHGAKLERA